MTGGPGSSGLAAGRGRFSRGWRWWVVSGLAWIPLLAAQSATGGSRTGEGIDFNRDIRPILSQNCFTCHGPDEAQRKGGSRRTGGLRLDTPEGQLADQGGYAAVVPGKPEDSELYLRLVTSDADDLMPPPQSGMKLTAEEVERVRQWIAEGATFSRHWSYVPPTRPPLPPVASSEGIRNGLDAFILARLESEGLGPQPEADRLTLARRVALDLTGLPPSMEEVDRFLADPAEDAYERYVDAQLAKPAYGEHWARLWLDLARYADSAGYADDPPRSIWAFRDYVIRAFNQNLPFDRFTVEQLAGDLLPEPTEDQLVATAFHRNTMTNSEGGTNDEEFRNVAVVDRVNTTFAVWMGTSMACAQCHTHKYDPITHHEYFQLFAFFNHTADADRPDEAPVLEFEDDALRERRLRLETELSALEQRFRSPSPEWVEAARAWARLFPVELPWQTLRPSHVQSKAGLTLRSLDDHSVRVESVDAGIMEDTYTVALPFDTEQQVTALRLEALADDSLVDRGPGWAGNFSVRQITAHLQAVPNQPGPQGRIVRIELPGKGFLQLAEVQVFSNGDNLALTGVARQSSTYEDAAAARAIDGRTEGAYQQGSVSHTREDQPAWWEVELPETRPLERIVVWNRTEAGERLAGFRVQVLDEQRQVVWEQGDNPAPTEHVALDLTGARRIAFATASSEFNEGNLDEALVVTDQPDPAAPNARRKRRGEKGWAVGGALGRDHSLVLIPKQPIEVPRGATLTLEIRQQSKVEKQLLGRFRWSATSDPRAADHAQAPAAILAALRLDADQRTPEVDERMVEHFVRYLAPGWQEERRRWAELEKQRDALRPFTVPVFRELPEEKRRSTYVHLRGEYQSRGDEVTEGVPAAWHPLPDDASRDRLALARWLMSPDNPLTARVIANRFWEQIFGIGLVRTSEEFGSQGDAPVNPALLDWLAVELQESGWDVKGFLRLLVTSRSYRQSSRVTPEAREKDPDNRLLSRGPRFRLSAEMIRDQALAVGGLLSSRRYGPSVRPPRPNLDLRAAFGGNLDWQTSPGEDRYRRGLYTEWRRTSPYPSMATFDAPSREVCTLRRDRSNTPLQALVTLNDPVYVEAAQALARRLYGVAEDTEARLRYGFRLTLARPPSEAELAELTALYTEARQALAPHPERALTLAQDPLGPPAFEADPVDLAAWTTVANVLLNLDETLMKP